MHNNQTHGLLLQSLAMACFLGKISNAASWEVFGSTWVELPGPIGNLAAISVNQKDPTVNRGRGRREPSENFCGLGEVWGERKKQRTETINFQVGPRKRCRGNGPENRPQANLQFGFRSSSVSIALKSKRKIKKNRRFLKKAKMERKPN